MTLHPSTFQYLKPTDEQLVRMEACRAAALSYASVIEHMVPDGPDKTFILRAHRANAMWVNVAITREADGTPRPDPMAEAMALADAMRAGAPNAAMPPRGMGDEMANDKPSGIGEVKNGGYTG